MSSPQSTQGGLEPPRMTDSPTSMSHASDEEEDGGEEADKSPKRNGHGGGAAAEDEEDEEEESDEEDDDDDEEEEEPALKYDRITGSIPDLFKKDSASALSVSNNFMALGMHSGIIHILDMSGKRIKSFKPHLASVLDIELDATAEWVASASMDGQVVVHSLTTPETYSFDLKRPMKTIALEPNFAKKGTRAFVYGGLAGSLILREKGWLGHKETIIHSGEGPIWQVRWKGRLIAWANDLGVKLYDHTAQTRISYIDRPSSSPRPDLFKCTLQWQDDSTLIIGWADIIKVARVRSRPRTANETAASNLSPLSVEVTAVFQLDCMICGILPHPTVVNIPNESLTAPAEAIQKKGMNAVQPTLTSFLVVAYVPPETFEDESTEDRVRQARKMAERPELRIISRAGEELSLDALSIKDFHLWGCNDYVLAAVSPNDSLEVQGRSYVVMSPRDLVHVKPRDRRDHVEWLVEKKRYEEALEEAEIIEAEGDGSLATEEEKEAGHGISSKAIGQRLIQHLVDEGDFVKAAQLLPKVCAGDARRWEHWVFSFAEKRQLKVVIPYVPTEKPRLDHVCYEMVLAHFLAYDRQTLLKTIREWPRGLYDMPAVINAVKADLDKATGKSSTLSSSSTSPDASILMECMAELYTANRQPGKALHFYLRLRRPDVFDLIKENNLFTDVQDQILLLVEFDHELMEKRKKEGWIGLGGGGGGGKDEPHSEAIRLLVDNYHSIPIVRVVQQLQEKPYYLFLYLDALLRKEPSLVTGFADLQVKLYAEFATVRLIDFLRASSAYNLERAFKICEERDLIPEMVFLLGRMGNNKRALTLIIERMGDVERAIEFAKEQGDDDLWEDLLGYAESRPAFIRGLLENVGVEISPIRLIRRIKNGLEIPGLKEALIKILQDFHLQISLLEGCREILDGDCGELGTRLARCQSSGFFMTGKTPCDVCLEPLHDNRQTAVFLFLCRHVVHGTCLQSDVSSSLEAIRLDGRARGIGASIAFESMVKVRLKDGCPVCHQRLLAVTLAPTALVASGVGSGKGGGAIGGGAIGGGVKGIGGVSAGTYGFR